MKFAFGKAVILGVALSAASLSGCSSDHSRSTSNSAGSTSENVGDLGLQLQVGDLTVTSVHYVLTNGTNSYTGDINVADAGTLTATIGGVIAGSGYTLNLSAGPADGGTAFACLASYGPFVVTANQTATATVILRCTKERNKGQVLIDGTFNECPDVTSVGGDAPSGCSIPLHVAATDDSKPLPAGLTYTWTGAPGLTGANPVLNCDTPGAKTLTVKVSDGDATCDETISLAVICPSYCPLVAATCVDGIQNQGETGVDCGGPCVAQGKTCGLNAGCVATADCTAPNTCQAGTCKAPVVCADPINNCGGPCAPCAVTTSSILAAKSAACLTCAQTKAACNALLTNTNCEQVTGNAAAGSPAAGQPKSLLCTNLLSKMLTTNCAGVDDGISACYCGAAGDTCFTAGGSGVAKAEEEAGLESTTPSVLEGSYTTTSLGGGRANKLVDCLANNCKSTCFN